MARTIVATLLVSLALTTLSGVVRADDELKTITDKGLKKTGPVFVLGDETEIENKMKDAIKVKSSKVMPAQKALKQAEQAVEAVKKQVEQGKKYIDKLDTELAAATTITKHNQLVGEYRKAEKAMEALEEQVEKAEKTEKEKRTAAMQAAEEYSEQLLKIRKLYDKVERQYKSFGTDKEIKEALEALNKADPKAKLKLGPSPTMVATGTKLKNLEGTVFSESVPIKQTEGDLWTATVVFEDDDNKTTALEMEIDTGASSVVLSHQMAKDIGIEPGPDAPIVRGQLANGQIVQGKQVIAPRIRVGKFEVRDVECLVFGPEYPNASALLGQSFLSKFVYKIDAVNSKLVMTQLDAPDGGSKSKTAPKKEGGSQE
jgi:clan AA aspartic protease (TIGR02281 family)